MACYDTSPYICTYDSGGNGSLPGGGNPDYSALDTWESASDNDLSGYSSPVILDCYDSQVHVDKIYISGATNTSATVYREVRSSSSCATPWAGKSGTGANFAITSGTGNFKVYENYCRLNSLYIENTSNVPATTYCVDIYSYIGMKLINVVVTGNNPNASGGTLGFYGNNVKGLLLYNCIALDCKTYGFYISGYATSSPISFINCVAINNGNVGFYPSSQLGYYYAWNCYGANNTNGDFREQYWRAGSGWNASKDNTADLGGTAAGDNYKNGLDLLTSGDMDAYGLALADDLYANGDAGDRYGRNPLDDLSFSCHFDNFLTRSNLERGKGFLEYEGAISASARAGCLLSPNADDMQLKSVSFYFGSTHGAAFRLAVYQGGSVESGPAGATLIHDFGLTSTSGTNQWQTLSIADGSEPALAKNTLTWIAFKYNNNNANYASYGPLEGDFLGTGRWVSASLATDETTAYPSTWPADAGAYGTDNHYALKIGIIGADPAVISGDASSTNDIRGTARPNGTTADSAWNVGASQKDASGYTDPTATGGFVFGGGVVEVSQTIYTDPAMTGGIVFGGEAVSGGGEDEIHSVDGTASGGIVFGGEVEEQWKAEPNNMVAVKGGTYRISGDLYTLSNSMSYPGLGDIAALVYCDLAPTTVGYYRYDLLSIGAAGTITVTAGTEAATPVMPSLPAGEIKVNHVLRYYGQTSIEQADIGKLYNVPTLATITATATDDELTWGQNSTAITIKCYDQYGALYTGSKSVTATISSGNGTVSPTTKSGTASSLSFTYTRGTESPMIEFASPAGPMTTVFIKLYDSNGDLMMPS